MGLGYKWGRLGNTSIFTPVHGGVCGTAQRPSPTAGVWCAVSLTLWLALPSPHPLGAPRPHLCCCTAPLAPLLGELARRA